jgi:hypothetical protein
MGLSLANKIKLVTKVLIALAVPTLAVLLLAELSEFKERALAAAEFGARDA